VWWLVAGAVAWLSLAAAADVSGKWKAEFTTPDGTARVSTFTFKVDGGNLSGTVAGGQDETPIKNGKISGNEIHLKVAFNDQNFEMTAKRVPN
jgi:hypothetical protein